jgi:hypothetical protein
LSKPQISAFCDENNLLYVFADFFDMKTISFVALLISLTLGRFPGCRRDVLYDRDDCFLRRDNIFGTRTLPPKAETIAFDLKPISPPWRRTSAKRRTSAQML